MKKLFLVKREVVASSIKEALRKRGDIYEVSLADEKDWPENKKIKKIDGFSPKKIT